MTNTETLHAIDALYLGNFRQTLFHKILHAQLELREYLKQAEALVLAIEVSPDCRRQYAEIVQRLLPPVSVLKEISHDMYNVCSSDADTCEPVQWGSADTIPEDETRAVISRLDAVEQETIKTLNSIGEALTSLPGVTASWNQWARLRVFYKLKPIPERPYYKHDSVRFNGCPPFLDAWCFAKPPIDAESDPVSHYLLDAEFMPLIYLPLLDDVEVEIEFKFDGGCSRTPHAKGVPTQDRASHEAENSH